MSRNAFEKWAKSEMPAMSMTVQAFAWAAWKAATNAALERAAEEIKQLDKKHWFSKQSKFAEFLVDAIRALKDES